MTSLFLLRYMLPINKGLLGAIVSVPISQASLMIYAESGVAISQYADIYPSIPCKS